MESQKNNDRRAERIDHHYNLRFRRVAPVLEKDWDMSTVRNISKTGMMFYSSKKYVQGDELEILIQNPLSDDDIQCFGIVIRSGTTPLETMKDVNEVAVTITKIDESKTNDFNRSMDFFIKKMKPS